MSSTSKTVQSGIICKLLVIGLLGLSMVSFVSGSELGKAEAAVIPQSDVEKMQQALRDKGHYRGKVDGVFGLRTRASIRAFQKTEKLPVTGRLDTQTAGKLGVRPEALGGGSYGSGRTIGQDRKRTSDKIVKGKPSAGIKRAKGSGRPPHTQPQVKTASNTEADREATRK